MRYLLIIMALGLCQCSSPGKTTHEKIEFVELSKGEAIDLAPHVMDGQFTVFDFGAEWCPPCKKLYKSMEGLERTYGDRITIYMLDIDQWDSELAKAFKIKDLPFLVAYDDKKEMIDSGPSNRVLPLLIKKLNQ